MCRAAYGTAASEQNSAPSLATLRLMSLGRSFMRAEGATRRSAEPLPGSLLAPSDSAPVQASPQRAPSNIARLRTRRCIEEQVRFHGNQRRHNPGKTIKHRTASSGTTTQMKTSQYDSRSKENRKIFRMRLNRRSVGLTSCRSAASGESATLPGASSDLGTSSRRSAAAAAVSQHIETWHQRTDRERRSDPRICRVIWTSAVRSTDSVSGQPMPWTRHSHRRGVRRPVSTAESVVLVCFRLKPPSSRVVAESPMVRSQPLITIEEIDVGIRCELGVSADARDPHRHFRRQQIKA